MFAFNFLVAIQYSKLTILKIMKVRCKNEQESG